ncbi:hypothetical protein [Psychroflexus salis]|uniref:Uncharacterized protein n=1 Tax=Psychroflexus salis TaxID=1526574 RepID=A0A916ZR96_9FLAO|nr:hypothetical protein [Psychroflexus salis]GGE10203.1 hypothetical protein GCM10010831_09640 [Psychroflexus salis]
MKYILLIFFLGYSISNYSQRNGFKNQTPEQLAQQRVERLDRELQLNQRQKKELNLFFIEQAKAGKSMAAEQKQKRKKVRKMKAERMKKREKAKNEQMKTRADINSLKQDTADKMKATLSAEQYEKWIALKENLEDELKAKRLKQLKKRRNRIEKKEKQIER